MALTRGQKGWVVVLAVFALAMPVSLLTGGGFVPPPHRVYTPKIDPPPPLGAALTRPLFAAAAQAEAPADAPTLVGIAGRLNVDAVAMVRTADGGTRTLAVGEGVDGWQLRALAIDAAFFTRGAQEARVPLPTE